MLSVATATCTRARGGDAVMPTLCGSGTKRARGQRKRDRLRDERIRMGAERGEQLDVRGGAVAGEQVAEHAGEAGVPCAECLPARRACHVTIFPALPAQRASIW